MTAGTAATPGLRRTWLAGAALLVVGLLVPGTGAVLAAPGLLVLAVAAGVTAGRGVAVGVRWYRLAWAVPLVPPVALAGGFAWLALRDADPMAVVVLLTIGGAAVLASWAVFLLALVVELVRLHLLPRRRFGGPPPAWKNGPTPPSYS